MQIGVHYDGIFYEFVPWNGVVNWEVAPWGSWYMEAENETHKVNIASCYSSYNCMESLATTMTKPLKRAKGVEGWYSCHLVYSPKLYA